MMVMFVVLVVVILIMVMDLCAIDQLLANICHAISTCLNQLQIEWNWVNKKSIKLTGAFTFPPLATTKPLPLISWPLRAATPPVTALTAWNNVCRICFFNFNASTVASLPYKRTASHRIGLIRRKTREIIIGMFGVAWDRLTQVWKLIGAVIRKNNKKLHTSCG